MHIILLQPFTALFSFMDSVLGALLARNKDPDTFTFDEAMSEDSDGWMDSAVIEVRSLQNHFVWVEVPVRETELRILPGIWEFRRKHSPDGTVRKLKGRYCVRGDLQENVPETYAPVAQFCTVRLFFS